jgi:hypothetical protein
MAEFEVEFQEIHKRHFRRISASDMDAACDIADGMLPEIVRQRGWLENHASVASVVLVRHTPQDSITGGGNG